MTKLNSKTKNSTHWGNRLSQALAERDINQKMAAKMAGVSASTFTGWLTGKSPSDFHAVKQLATALDVEFSWLLTGESENPISSPLISDLFTEDTLFDGLCRVRIDRLVKRTDE